MHRWTPYAFVRITFFFVAGILSAVYLGPFLDENLGWWLVGGLSVFYLVLVFVVQPKFFFHINWLFSLVGFAVVFLVGYLNLVRVNESHDPDHLLHQQQVDSYIGIIDSQAEETEKTNRYEVVIKSVLVGDSVAPIKGRIHLFVDKSKQVLTYGDAVAVLGSPVEITPPMNPDEFDYKRYLTFQSVHHQHYVGKNDSLIVITNTPPNILLKKAYELRNAAGRILRLNIEGEHEQAIALALVLGIKDGLNTEIKNAYSASGAMHVLAVSGLHVGIVYAIVLLLLRPLKRNNTGKWIIAILGMMVLWSYALVTGFSPSVLRAVTMFSFIAVATAANRKTNIYNTLATSAFALLLYNPYLIMSVGFQLSYLAVVGIVFIQPKIYHLFYVQNAFLDKIWTITAVSIAAQIATFPLGILYFHQFPTFFFLSNLVVIPGAFVILCLGLMMLFFSWIPSVLTWLGKLLSWIIYAVNWLVFKIQEIPYSQITEIEITTFQSWLIIASILCMIFLFQYRAFKYLILFALSILLLVSIEISQSLKANTQNRITIYRVSNHIAIDFIRGSASYLYTDSVFIKNEESMRFHVRPNRLYSGINNINFIEEESPISTDFDSFKLIVWNEKKMLILKEKIDKKVSFDPKPYFDYILIGNGSDADLNWLNDNFEFGKIILDGSLKWYYANAMQKELVKGGVPFYSVHHSGALDINLNE